jgi:hypothetical protein
MPASFDGTDNNVSLQGEQGCNGHGTRTGPPASWRRNIPPTAVVGLSVVRLDKTGKALSFHLSMEPLVVLLFGIVQFRPIAQGSTLRAFHT